MPEPFGYDDVARRWAVVSSHRQRLLALARSRVPNEADAEDCAHEAMVRAMEFAGLDEERLAQFLTSVTLRLCADQHRGRARRTRAGSRLALRETTEPGPEEAVCDQAEAEWIAQHVAALPQSQRAVLHARADGLSGLGVARLLAVPETTVESALARARRSMRRVLESSLGVAPWVRRAVAAGVATATAVTLLHLPDAPRSRPESRAVPPVTTPVPGPPPAGPPAAPAAEPATPATAAGRDRPRVAPSRPRLELGPLAKTYPPVSFAGPNGVRGGIEEADPGWPEYPPEERVRHCLEYGVYVAPSTDCGYPPGDPRNDRFPPDSIVVRVPRPSQEPL